MVGGAVGSERHFGRFYETIELVFCERRQHRLLYDSVTALSPDHRQSVGHADCQNTGWRYGVSLVWNYSDLLSGHVAHLRAGAYGEALAAIIQFPLSLVMITIFAYSQADSRPNHLMTDADSTDGGNNNCVEC